MCGAVVPATVVGMSEPELQWVDEPPSRCAGNYGKWRRVAEQLRARPGKWALIETIQRGASSSGRTAMRAYAGVEVTQRTRGDGANTDVYARYVGDNGDG